MVRRLFGTLRTGTWNLVVPRSGYTLASPAVTLTVGPSQAGVRILAIAP